MDTASSLPTRQLELLEALLRVPAGDLHSTLSQVVDLIAGATSADKIDAFIYDPARDSLYAVGTSTQPLSALQRVMRLVEASVLAVALFSSTVALVSNLVALLGG